MHKKILRFSKRAFISAHFGRFILVGSANTGVDMTLFMVLSSVLHLPVILANILSTSVALCLSFFLNKHFVFKADSTTSTHFVQFIAWTLFNVWLIQTMVIVLATNVLDGMIAETWQLHAVAKICGIGVSMVLNFLGYRYIFNANKTT